MRKTCISAFVNWQFILCFNAYLGINFRFQANVWHGYQDKKQKSLSFNDAANVTAGRNYYKIHVWDMTQSKVGANHEILKMKSKIELKSFFDKCDYDGKKFSLTGYS